ncbi:hypothetical protein KEM56_006638, partial [Ascosphaera pollenicola]
KEGKEKWDTKAAQIHKLVNSNGMDVFSKYFRRLLSGNAAQIFPNINKPVENAGNYPLLVQEVNKVAVGATDLEQAQKIADTIDSAVAGETPVTAATTTTSTTTTTTTTTTTSTATNAPGVNANAPPATAGTVGPSSSNASTGAAAAVVGSANAATASQTGHGGDVFRDFDLGAFVEHFRLDPIAKVALVLAFRNVGRVDLRTKADVILLTAMPQFLISLSTVTETNKDFTTSFIAALLERLILNPPKSYSLMDLRTDLVYAITSRFASSTPATPAPGIGAHAAGGIPVEIDNALQMFGLSDPKLALVRQIQVKGPKAMQSQESIADLINSVSNDSSNCGVNGWDEEQIATALLFITISASWRQYSPQLFLSTVQRLGPEGFDWSILPRGFDRPYMRIDTDQFVRLFNTLLAISRDTSSASSALDVQSLWGGEWKNRDCHFSFLAAFVSSTIDVTTIPNFRPAFSLDIFADVTSETLQAQVAAAARNPYRSLDAINATIDLCLRSIPTFSAQDSQHFIIQYIQPQLPVFLVSVFAIPQPWAQVLTNFIYKAIGLFLMTKLDGYEFALHGSWKVGRATVIEALFRAFHADPTCSELIYEHVAERGWLDDVLESMNGLSMDLACIAYQRNPNFDLEKWVNDVARSPIHIGEMLAKYLKIKAEDELAFQRKETPVHRMIPLGAKTVFTILLVLEDIIGDQKSLHDIQRVCVQTYPRLINYGDGFDDIIEANSMHGNGLPDQVEKEMQDLFGKMYHEELSLRQVLEIMRRYKASRDPHEQDLFTCMVHGLIDEYNCYPEYPIEALSKAAVLFGGLINFRLVSGITLKVCLSLILDSVKGRSPDEMMFKFGVEAIEQIVGRLDEWAGFCAELLQIPTLRGTPLYTKASEVVRDQGRAQPQAVPHEILDGSPVNQIAHEEEVEEELQHRPFRALHVDPPIRPEIYREPDEDVHDKILFILNNVSEQNIDDKLKDLKEVLLDEHHQWFASYLVEERAKLQPNFQQLYLYLLDLINDKLLWAEVLRETYASAIRLLNAESTLHNSTDRNYLKNLGSWLGSLTIARDKPVKHRNIYFKDLLIDAFDTQRLTVAIPFTCKVLVQARKSTIFKPPNPWLMDVLSLLTEIYHFGDLKMILKFEIEVVCQDLKIDLKSLTPSTYIRERPPVQLEEVISATASMPEELQGFEDLSLAAINGTAPRMSPSTILQGLPSLDQVLVIPAAASTVMDPLILRNILATAVERAIAEIITPVVERSITIASISAAHLINKDFAMEPDEEKYHHSAVSMVRALAGSLALVTCKEPLKMSMMNYMKMAQQDYPDQPMPETLVLMCVNENLDAACGIVEKAAEEKSVPEMEKMIEPALEARRVHRVTNPSEPFVDSNISRWSLLIPEPYRQLPGGLNDQQLAIYEYFSHHPRAGHMPQLSTDSGKPMPDMIPDNYGAVPSMQTPGQIAAVPQVPQVEAVQQQVAAGTPQANGFASPTMTADPQERLRQLVHRVQESARNAGVEHIKDLPKDTPILAEYHSVIKALYALPNADHFARYAAQVICVSLHEMTETNIEAEILVHLLSRICELAPVITKDTRTHLAFQNESRLFSIPTLIALNEVGLLEFAMVDPVIAKLLKSQNMEALEILSGLLDRVLLNDEPVALRSDFTASLEAMGLWLTEDPGLTLATEIIQKLRDCGIPEVVAPLLSDNARSQRDQMEYIFSEWLGLYKSISPGDMKYLVFLDDLHDRRTMDNQETSALFLRVAIDLSVAMFEHVCQTPRGNLDEAFLAVDALAKLIILLVKHQGYVEQEPDRKSKPEYLRSILSIITLVMNHHHVMRGVAFNQRVFFRLFSSILCEYYELQLNQSTNNNEMVMVFAETFLATQPVYMPAFTFGWTGLISHRDFLAGILNMPDQAGWPIYCELIQALLLHIGEQLKAPMSWHTRDLYNGVLRIILILHHDFPEFILENHYSFCNAIPAHCSQLRNLILSAYPSSFPKLPDPFREGLKMDSLEEIRQTPKVAGNISGPLDRAGIKNIVNDCLKSGPKEEAIQQIRSAVYKPLVKETALSHLPIEVDVLLLNALVLYVGNDAVAPINRKTDFADAHATALLDRLSKVFDPEARYYLLSGVANQLRYPNSHTNYFSFFMLHHFESEPAEEQTGLEIREQIVRVLLERLIVHRPHPWGLIITLQELLRGRNYHFFELPFIQQTPEIGRLFDALLAHIQQQSPRVA